MTNYTDVTVKAQNAGSGLCFLLLLAVWAGVFFIPEAIFLVVPGMIGFALLFFIYYLASEGHLAGILGGIVVSVIFDGNRRCDTRYRLDNPNMLDTLQHREGI
ncbi:TPA: hypothetical protein ACV4I4_002417 [Salmonella enterica]